jgi:cation diffusion facilitator CzcD-associated flavoprotein CzcO
MPEGLETDYLVVGAGAAGMAITGELLEHSSATVTIVDRRHAPGGHWLDAYPYVRLHQPSAFYGVSTFRSGTTQSIDRVPTPALRARRRR